MSREDISLFSCYGMRREGKSYYEKMKEKDKEIERLKLHIMKIKEVISTWNIENDEGYNEFKIPKKITDVVWGDKE